MNATILSFHIESPSNRKTSVAAVTTSDADPLFKGVDPDQLPDPEIFLQKDELGKNYVQ